MATREENLKKINAELNKLSDDELDKVAGGCMDYHTWKRQQPTPNPFDLPNPLESPVIENPITDPPSIPKEMQQYVTFNPKITKENQQYVTRNPTINNSILTKINE